MAETFLAVKLSGDDGNEMQETAWSRREFAHVNHEPLGTREKLSKTIVDKRHCYESAWKPTCYADLRRLCKREKRCLIVTGNSMIKFSGTNLRRSA